MVEASKILPAVLIALVLVSAVQAFQLNSLKEKVESGTLSVSSGSKGAVSVGSGDGGSAVASSGSGSTGAASSIADLPQMVGGC
ncbi:hypothetical protein HYV85_01485 [Candidatus Woesearchaeota archaeon]|nr:hypothetical protein [Candidatus Woesearchaeota archaeon]